MDGNEAERTLDMPPPLNHTPETRKSMREQMASEVEAFLKAGGRVQVVEEGERADPPRKPESQYGSRPI